MNGLCSALRYTPPASSAAATQSHHPRCNVENNSVRILHVTPYSADAWAYGGIPRLVAALTRGLARRGHRVTICTTDACDASSRLSGTPHGIARFGPWPLRHTPDGVDV